MSIFQPPTLMPAPTSNQRERLWKVHTLTSRQTIISPLFANIYLHELDKFVAKSAHDFDKPRTQKYTNEYDLLQRKIKSIGKKADRSDGEEKQRLLEERKAAKAELLKTPSKSQTDKKIKYIRYADDFIIGVNGSKDDCVQIKKQLSEFTADSLRMELSDEKTLITHSNNYARFLGYDVRVRRDNRTITNGGTSGFAKRTLNNMTELVVPLQDKIMKFLFDRGAVVQKNGTIKPMHRKSLLHCTDLEIVSSYNAELRGICNYYSMASNF